MTAAKKSRPAPPSAQRAAEARYPAQWRHKSIGEQVRRFVSGELSPEFRRLNASFIDAIVSQEAADDGMDGWIVHPKPSRLAGSGTGERDWPTVSRALASVVRLFARREDGFVDLTEGRIGPEHHRITEQAQAAFSSLEARFPGDFLVYRAQTGMRRRSSAATARAALGSGEFGLDALAVGCFLLVHFYWCIPNVSSAWRRWASTASVANTARIQQVIFRRRRLGCASTAATASVWVLPTWTTRTQRSVVRPGYCRAEARCLQGGGAASRLMALQARS
jgi:hypothetical protein